MKVLIVPNKLREFHPDLDKGRSLIRGICEEGGNVMTLYSRSNTLQVTWYIYVNSFKFTLIILFNY